MFGISVVFYERGYWSKRYTYLSKEDLPAGAAVLVPAGKWYSVGKVVESTMSPVLDPLISYKHVLQVLEIRQEKPSSGKAESDFNDLIKLIKVPPLK